MDRFWRVLLWSLFVGLFVGLPIGVIYVLSSWTDDSPGYYSANTLTQKYEWGAFHMWIAIPYSADVPREALQESYKTNVFIEAAPNAAVIDRECLFKPTFLKVVETDFESVLIEAEGFWTAERGEGRRLYDRDKTQIALYSLPLYISPDHTAFNIRLNYEIICGAEIKTYQFNQSFNRRIGRSVNFHIR